jgi:hypothetical protein
MKKITMRQARNIMEKVEKYKKENKVRDYRDLLPFIEKYGFEEEILGTGESCVTWSCNVDIKYLESRKYLNGLYLVIGKASRNIGGYTYYHGFVLPIK